MNILFTGGSSFTGYWFAKTLVQAGHQLTLAIKSPLSSYEGIRGERLKQLLPLCAVIDNAPLGSSLFHQLSTKQSWDLFCHHGAHVYNYKSLDFNPVEALENNTKGLRSLIESGSIGTLLLSGSVFEEGEGSEPSALPVSPYGLSKSLTTSYLRYFCSLAKIPFQQFIIPNPFGPYEEARYTAYLMKQWKNNESVHIQTPDYIRDNIPVDLLSLAYLECVKQKGDLRPSGYRESQAAFTERCAQAVRSRSNLVCTYTQAQQNSWTEPRVRVNRDSQLNHLAWSEKAFWDAFIEYYL